MPPRSGGTSASALVLAGFGGGAVLAATGTADAVTGTSSSTSTTGHSGETALTGTTAAKVRAAALAKYPGATIERVETDSDGVYEAHLTTKAGDEITVEVNKSFAVTGTETGGHGSHGHGNETALTGTTAAKVKAAALAKYPGATVERVETDSDGVYEAHLTTRAGDEITVQVNKSFTVTGTETGGHGGHGGHGNETALTGTTATKVKAAALAKYPGATIERLETDSDGVYEAHLTTKAGDEITVQVDKSFAVTGTQTSGGHGDHDGDATDSSSSPS